MRKVKVICFAKQYRGEARSMIPNSTTPSIAFKKAKLKDVKKFL